MKRLNLILTLGTCMSIGLLAKDQQLTVLDKTFIPSITHSTISTRVAELGAQITADYAGKKPILIGVLNGAFIFLADLARAIDLECTIDFIQVGSYGESTSSSGSVKLIQDIKHSITGRDVIIVEDIVETGLTIQFLLEHLRAANPSSIRVATLLHKNVGPLNFTVDYVGFSIKPEFVIGYGLDYAHTARNLKDIYKLADAE